MHVWLWIDAIEHVLQALQTGVDRNVDQRFVVCDPIAELVQVAHVSFQHPMAVNEGAPSCSAGE
jgi:hypothetical protein